MKLRGTQDFFGPKESLFRRVERLAEEVLEDYGYERIRFPLIERAELFKRNIASSDIVNKELYEFEDRGGRDIVLVPEGTAPVTRAISEASLFPCKLYYISPLFRYDRPQKGRFRQHHQIGAESVGFAEEFADAEIVLVISAILKKLNIETTLETNFLGSSDTREEYKKYLVDFVSDKALCDDCLKRRYQNILRVLDCKRCDFNVKSIEEFLSKEERESYDKILATLQDNGVEASKKNIVRGLDYYTGFVFELINGNAVAGGGRYDSLYNQVSKYDLPAVGFGSGIERIMSFLEEIESERDDIAVIYVTEEEKREAFNIVNILRESGIKASFSLGSSKMKKQLSKANAKYSLIVGKEELDNKIFTIKDMDSSTQEKITLENVIRRFNV